jgi:hypothetical protein
VGAGDIGIEEERESYEAGENISETRDQVSVRLRNSLFG